LRGRAVRPVDVPEDVPEDVPPEDEPPSEAPEDDAPEGVMLPPDELAADERPAVAGDTELPEERASTAGLGRFLR
jgi:hypothetical protein